jgi:hypothetical protein
VQVIPHAPQFVTVRTLVSQPFVGSRSQSAYPAWQAGAHSPLEHSDVPWSFEQVVVQRPQAPALLVTSVSHPFVALLSQSEYPVEHCATHVPVSQEAVPCRFSHAVGHSGGTGGIELSCPGAPESVLPPPPPPLSRTCASMDEPESGGFGVPPLSAAEASCGTGNSFTPTRPQPPRVENATSTSATDAEQ